MNEDIDVVICWVDGSDSVWRDKRALHSDIPTEGERRYRDYGTLKYLFRSLEKFAPWVHKIHFITDNQVPKWLKKEHPKLNLVHHTDFIPQEYLPTFNSNVIELNLFRLKELSEKFILFNDDMFLNGEVAPEDFFKENKIMDYGIYNRIAPNDQFAHILLNNTIVINKYFDKRSSLKKNWQKVFRLRYGSKVLSNFFVLPWKEVTGYYNPHFPQPHFKSKLSQLYELEPEIFRNTFKNRFRGNEDISHWLCRYWLLEEGRYEPQKMSFGSYLLLSELDKIDLVIQSEKAKVLCINDVDCSDEEFEFNKERLNASFQAKFADVSSFEIKL